MRQLNDTKFYKQLDNDLILTKFNNALLSMYNVCMLTSTDYMTKNYNVFLYNLKLNLVVSIFSPNFTKLVTLGIL